MTDDKRYAPPAAAVADPQPLAPLMERPKQVQFAVGLLWLTLALGIPSWLLSATRDPEMGFHWAMVGVTVLLFAVSAYLNLVIYQGKNWARIVFLCLYLLSVVLLLIPMEEEEALSLAEQAITWFNMAAEAVAMVLVFTRPGSLWFRPASS
jgi:hypothetical protein